MPATQFACLTVAQTVIFSSAVFVVGVSVFVLSIRQQKQRAMAESGARLKDEAGGDTELGSAPGSPGSANKKAGSSHKRSAPEEVTVSAPDDEVLDGAAI